MEFSYVASHLAKRPSMTIDEQKMFERFRLMNPPTYTSELTEDAYEFIRESKRTEFEGLQQGSMSMVEYEGKFHALARHASIKLPTEAERKEVDAAKELEMIRREGFEQREGKRTRYSGDYGGSPPRSRGYLGRGCPPQSSRPIHTSIPASKLCYTGYSSSSLVHTSQGSSSRPVVCGGHSSNSGSSRQPAPRRGCLECGDMGHYVRDCPRTRRDGLHQGCYTSTFKAAQPPARGGAQSGRGGSYSGRGCSSSGRGGGRGNSQYEGSRFHCYGFLGRTEAEASDAVITGIILVCHRPTTVFFDPDSTYSYVSTYFAPSLDILSESLDLPIHVSTLVGDSVVFDWVYRLCIVTLMGYATHVDLKRGCLAYLAHIRDTNVETPMLESILVVSEFSEVVPTDLPSLLQDYDIDFCIYVESGTQPISIPPYHMASSEFKEWKEHLKDLLSKGFI
ncbi:uncharacterized protein LOC114074926 [Solanum pennellii]|uniref:Uncharacterized protein LOC114074926 n=1 Tax=Solanum pennellii TaxID=28526 RepID=A0ABM1UZS0_SOLPN|nr:uncharacterized protein LOC114074926 [Solanum pennellii]